MAVFADDVIGTIGGGRIEFEAIDEARLRLASAASGDSLGGAKPADTVRYPLGPSLGQCCGGVMHLRYELVNAADLSELGVRLARKSLPVTVFGGGHVGKALIRVLASLPLIAPGQSGTK